MKNNHGNRILITLTLLLGFAALNAQGFTTDFKLSREHPYVKEAVVLTLDIEQTDHSKVMLFKFSPKESKAYEFHRIDIKKEDAYHAVKIHYVYLLYPLKSGKIDIYFDLLQMVTTDEKVAFSFSGDRDNVRGLNKVDTPILLPPLPIDVRPLPKGTQLVGDFKLSYRIEKQRAKSYEPLPLTLTIQGDGYPPIVNDIIPPHKNFSLFEGQREQKISRTKKGTDGSVTYPLALSAKESFTLPTISIKAFDPVAERTYELSIPQEHFTIVQPDREDLVDEIDSPRPLESDWRWIGSLLEYLAIFVAGFLTANIIKWRPKPKIIQVKDRLKLEIDACKSHKELLALLLASDSRRYQKSIEQLESSLYEGKRVSLEKIKSLIV